MDDGDEWTGKLTHVYLLGGRVVQGNNQGQSQGFVGEENMGKEENVDKAEMAAEELEGPEGGEGGGGEAASAASAASASSVLREAMAAAGGGGGSGGSGALEWRDVIPHPAPQTQVLGAEIWEALCWRRGTLRYVHRMMSREETPYGTFIE